jgi:hypothetical protein
MLKYIFRLENEVPYVDYPAASVGPSQKITNVLMNILRIYLFACSLALKVLLCLRIRL